MKVGPEGDCSPMTLGCLLPSSCPPRPLIKHLPPGTLKQTSMKSSATCSHLLRITSGCLAVFLTVNFKKLSRKYSYFDSLTSRAPICL